MSLLEIRPAVPGDLEVIVSLLAEDSMHYFDEPDGVTDRQQEAVEEILADAHQDLLVGEVDGRVVCTAQVTWIRMIAADGGLYCQVEAVRTSGRLRRRSVGATLMAYIEAEARRRGAARMQLTSNRERVRAHEFYQRLGYVANHVGMKKYL